MKPARFDYLQATSVTEAVGALAAAEGEAKILAGGQSLVPLMALRMGRPSLVVDVNRIPGLGGMAIADGVVRIGALTRHSALSEQRAHPLLAEAARWIGHQAIRSRGTVGGSIAHADPSAELPVVATALDAVALVANPAGRRRIPAADLFAGPFETTLGHDEMIIALDFPVPRRWGFAELSRRHGDFGLVTVAAAEIDGRVRIAVGGVGGVPYRAVDAEARLADVELTPAAFDEAARLTASGIDPADDLHATAAYRRAMTAEHTRRALLRLRERPEGVPA
ncbi:xanthine dehydrogenase family protein subunit M [Actinomadura sp. LD22]|uniref:Xanthine dehydrogenase family protein subunit M n=1 Tax=Actinomadura physcomitrii TaxID=2650748 RepID=A0A6I4M648_9ACTN|nr:xanthine dehydrogenase family protein subunit M [Actinomadura physcomitrii]